MYFSGKITSMKKATYPLLTLLLLLLTNCGENKDFTLKGNISGLSSDTLLVYYQLPKHKLDTIITQNGAFEYTITPDTFSIFTLILDSVNTYPIYVDKGQKVELSGTKEELQCIGEGENQKLNEIRSILKNVSPDSLLHKVDSIIQKNSFSFTNLYLLDKYYVNQPSPSYHKIKTLINGMGGIIRETPYMMNLQAKIEQNSNKDKNRNVYNLIIKDRKGKNIQWTSIRDQYILLDFWASWDKNSVAAQDSLVPVLKALKKEKFLVISVSLDLDKDEWLKASDRDTTQWLQVCDFTGWNNRLVKDQNIHTLPSNILLDKNKRVLERDIRGTELIDKVKSLIQDDKTREKARKESERKRRLKR